MVAAAVIFPPGEGLRGVDDSKRLEPAEREELAGKVRESAVAWAVAATVNRLRIAAAGSSEVDSPDAASARQEHLHRQSSGHGLM